MPSCPRCGHPADTAPAVCTRCGYGVPAEGEGAKPVSAAKVLLTAVLLALLSALVLLVLWYVEETGRLGR
jgi:hypothetical protein